MAKHKRFTEAELRMIDTMRMYKFSTREIAARFGVKTQVLYDLQKRRELK